MSNNDNNIYSKAIPFIIVATVVILFGTIITVFIPLMMKEMHPKLADLKPYTALELAGRNIYQKEGCVNCHTQTIRPLKSDVLRYGEYSKAGENYYERPFLWGSKRTGKDLSREGGRMSDEWHYAHFLNPQRFYPESNMPKYTWLENAPIDIHETERGMIALNFPYTKPEIEELKNKTQLEALIAYMQVIGTSVENKMLITVDENEYMNQASPLKGSIGSLDRGRYLYDSNCIGCHGVNGEGTDLGSGMKDLLTADTPDGQAFVTIANGMEGLMPEHISFMTKKDIWSLVEYCRQLAEKSK